MPRASFRVGKHILGRDDGRRDVFRTVAWLENCEHVTRIAVVAQAADWIPQSCCNHRISLGQDVYDEQRALGERRDIER